MTLTIIGREKKKKTTPSTRDWTSADRVQQEQLLDAQAERIGSVRGGDFQKNIADFHAALDSARLRFASSEQASEFCERLEQSIRNLHEKKPLIQGHINPTSLLDLMDSGR